MKILDSLKFKLGRWALKGFASRGYSEVAGVSRQMSDWITSGMSDDADLVSNWPALVQKSRDLSKLNPYMRKLRVDRIANVFGHGGIVLQMKVKEQADRVVYAAEEKSWLEAKQRSHDDLRKRAKKRGLHLRKRDFVTEQTIGNNGSARVKAVVKAGQPDTYANNLIERAWKEWQKRQNCTVSKRHTYGETREQRLTMCARDGDVFIRHVRGKAAARNDFGYAIQLIASEWVDHALNQILPNGNYIKMGVEYDQWEAVVAYHVIKRQPGDWQSSSVTSPGRWFTGMTHERVDAADMIHYCVFEDSQTGRGAPWSTSIMTKLRHLDKYSEAEVISARAEACKGGHYESTMGSGNAADLAEYIERIEKGEERLTDVVEPAMWKALPPFWTAKPHDPKHPNGNYPAFKKEALREISVGAGDFYNTMAGDMEGVNYSSMRGGFLDIREMWMLIQRFDIDTAEVAIFEAWLEMALMTNAVPLPSSKFDKFNSPMFQGRRWPWVDPRSDAIADATQLQMITTSRTRICNENGVDFEEIVEEQAIEKLLAEEAGLSAEVDQIAADALQQPTDAGQEPQSGSTPKPKKQKKPKLTPART